MFLKVFIILNGFQFYFIMIWAGLGQHPNLSILDPPQFDMHSGGVMHYAAYSMPNKLIVIL